MLTPTPTPRGRFDSGDGNQDPSAVVFGTGSAPHVESVTMDGVQWDMLSVDAVRVALYNPATTATTIYDSSTFTSMAATSNGYTIVIGSVTVTVSYVVSDNVITWSASEVNSGSMAVLWIEWPRFRLTPPSEDAANTYLAIPVWGGFVVKEPSADTTERTQSMPSCLGFFGYWDSQSKRVFYIEKRDDGGYGSDIVYQGGASDSLTISVRHFCGANKTAGNDWTQPYEIRTKTLTVNGDGRTGYVDCANEYRSWALAKTGSAYDRAWVEGIRTTRGRWYDGLAGYSSRVSNAKMWITYQDPGAHGTSAPNWTAITTDLTRTHDLVVADYSKMLVCIYDWHGSAFDTTAPTKLPARTGYSAWVTATQTSGAHVFPYALLPYWDTTNVAPYLINDYTAFHVDLRTAMYRNPDQSYQLGSVLGAPTATVAGFNPYHALTSTAWLLVLQEYLLSGAATRGFYADQMCGTTFSNFDYNSAISPNGNRGGQIMNKWTRLKELTDAAKSFDAGAFMFAEQFEEAALGGVEGTLSLQNAGGVFGLYVQANVVPMVYGQFYRRLDYTVQIANPNDPGGALGYAQQVIGHWLGGGLLGYHNGSTGTFTPALNNATPASSDLAYTFAVIKYLHDAHDLALDAFKGVEQRPLPNSWQLRAIDEAAGSATGLAGWLQANQLTHPKSVWKTDDGIVWVVRVNHNTTDADLIEFDVIDYGMAETTTKTLYRDTGSGPVSVGTFTASVSYTDASPTPLGVTVFKLVEAS